VFTHSKHIFKINFTHTFISTALPNSNLLCNILCLTFLFEQVLRPGVPLEHYRLHQDNSLLHTAASTQLEIHVLGFGRVDHPTYSPDLAPLDFALIPEVKLQLKGHRFHPSRNYAQLQQTSSHNITRID